ncbi:DUF305 domain-containing protein [Streptomyces sp. AK02-01A]|uniref:DUF305 domain-containing protein n=1 Tax=Streptomyces sp. AK02-01A TaxID=3028648 RepID=UPI0029A4CD0B|nr:DUF305 domain-containing protein [Streptomyces sp. AK02-01A]MDX3850091.1 DUF305 domain-containing protein [Streptomyces sp. AK02-01A]
MRRQRASVMAWGGGRPHNGGPPPRTRLRRDGRGGTALPVLLMALILLGTGGCADSSTPPGDAPSRTAAAGRAEDPAAGPGPSAPATGTGGFNATDRGWAQLMVPMNERTLLLLDLISDRASDSGLSDLARRTTVTHRAELTRLRTVLKKSGAEGTNPHEGHDMKGMVTDAELRTVAASRGAAFDDISMTYFREHLEQTILVSRGEEHSGAEPTATGLAAELEKRRAQQLEELRRLGG